MPQVENVDPQSEVALSLLREAAFEARQLYPELSFPNVLATNAPLQEGEIYVVVRVEEQPLACGALRRIDPQTAEVKRIFVRKGHRREGLGRKILDYLQCEARPWATGG